MSLVVLLVLAVIWAAFLTPQVLRARAEKTPADSIGAFQNQLSVLERTAPAGMGRSYRAAAPYGRTLRGVSQRELARKRRRDILFALLAAMGTTLLLGMVPVFHVLLLVHVLLDGLFVAYCALLVRASNVVAEREMKVRYLPGRPMLVPEPQLLLRSSHG